MADPITRDTIEHTADGLDVFELDKRFYMPGYVLKSQCPKCGKGYENDFGDGYLSYPMANRPEVWNCCCQDWDCGGEWTVSVIVRVTLELAPAEVSHG